MHYIENICLTGLEHICLQARPPCIFQPKFFKGCGCEEVNYLLTSADSDHILILTLFDLSAAFNTTIMPYC